MFAKKIEKYIHYYIFLQDKINVYLSGPVTMAFGISKTDSIAIVGFGLEGQSTLRFLLKNHISPLQITIHDQKKCSYPGVGRVCGDNYLDDLHRYDHIFLSPGISIYDKKLEKVKDRIITQTQLFFNHYKGKVITITGTKGKSTISTLLHKILQSAGFKTELVGNIGKPVLDVVSLDGRDDYDYLVYETSSYMLEGLNKKNEIAIISNIYPDHLDRHRGFENYKNAKINNLKGAKYKLVNEETIISQKLDTIFDDLISFGLGGQYHFHDNCFMKGKEKLFEIDEIGLSGIHNITNICSIIAVCDILGIDIDVIKTSLKSFVGLPHRIQYVGTYRDVLFYDDAASTTPQSAIAALNTLKGDIGTIMLGGTDRGYDFQDLVDLIVLQNIKNIVLFPDTGKRIEGLLPSDVRFIHTSDMKEAVEFAYKHTPKGKICLLSTASPSYSVRKNSSEKGDIFQKEVIEQATK